MLFDPRPKTRREDLFGRDKELRGPRANEVLNAIAHAYDYDRNITFILTGSEVVFSTIF